MANNVPQGYRWIRELVPDVQWDEATRTIKLPGGPSVPLSATLAKGGKAYVTPQQLSSWYATYQQPSNITPEAVQQKADIFKQIMQPQADYWKQYLDFSLRKAVETAEQQRRLAEAAHQTAAQSLHQREIADWNTMMEDYLARGRRGPALVSMVKQKTAEAYAPQYQQLETNRAAQLANIASQAALAAEELALKGKEMEANWASQMAQYALDALAQEAQQQQAYRENLVNYFSQLGTQDWQKMFQEAELTGYYQGKPTLSRQIQEWSKALQEANVTGHYKGQPTWERQYQSSLLKMQRQQQAAKSQAQTAKQREAESKDLADGIIADMRAGYWRFRDRPHKYNYQWHIDVAKNTGIWDRLTNEDKARVQAEANKLGQMPAQTQTTDNPWARRR